ncbi:MAG: hypothetical protein IPG63_05580 [Xanthomonadales bacterium]|nr:hypothetical protein [Xanthomonadales bacterium]MBK7143918.1 hypothetical protein [Xanthomonadales bacterium]MCC6560596.1 hypothetical protein [Xanthomonadales bacterium]
MGRNLHEILDDLFSDRVQRTAALAAGARTARARLAEADHSIEQSGQNPAWLRQERESVAGLVEQGAHPLRER